MLISCLYMPIFRQKELEGEPVQTQEINMKGGKAAYLTVIFVLYLASIINGLLDTGPGLKGGGIGLRWWQEIGWINSRPCKNSVIINGKYQSRLLSVIQFAPKSMRKSSFPFLAFLAFSEALDAAVTAEFSFLPLLPNFQ